MSPVAVSLIVFIVLIAGACGVHMIETLAGGRKRPLPATLQAPLPARAR